MQASVDGQPHWYRRAISAFRVLVFTRRLVLGFVLLDIVVCLRADDI